MARSETKQDPEALALMAPNAGAWARCAEVWLLNFESERTRATYTAAWRDFVKWNGATDPGALAQRDIIAYRDYLSAAKKSGSTIANRLAAIASFYETARELGLVVINPAAAVKRPKVEAYRAAKWLTTREAAALLRAPDRSTLEGKRDYAILLSLLTMGLRRAEVLGMRRGDIVEGGERCELRYKPKGGTEKTRPIPAPAWRAIAEYIAARGELAEDAAIFVAHDRAAKEGERDSALTGEALRYIVAKYSRAALGRVINPHALRHTCAGAAWDSTRDLHRVQNLLGHASATTTERYLHRRDDDRGELGEALAAVYEAC